MDALSYAFIGGAAVLGGGLSYAVWSLKRCIANWAETRRLAKIATEEVEDDTDDDPIFHDVIQKPVPPPEPQVDLTAEFARLHKAVGEIARAQVRMIEASETEEEAEAVVPIEEQIAQALAPLAEKVEALTPLLARLDDLGEQVEAMSAQLVDAPAQTAQLELLDGLSKRPDAPDIQAISDLVLPQIALLGQDVQDLAGQLAGMQPVLAGLVERSEVLPVGAAPAEGQEMASDDTLPEVDQVVAGMTGDVAAEMDLADVGFVSGGDGPESGEAALALPGDTDEDLGSTVGVSEQPDDLQTASVADEPAPLPDGGGVLSAEGDTDPDGPAKPLARKGVSYVPAASTKPRKPVGALESEGLLQA
ncbi:hypothetical protein [Halovulum sp. GXIMD14793]